MIFFELMPTQIVINDCFGGFGLSKKALAILSKVKGHPVMSSDFGSTKMRMDADLVAVVEALGPKSWSDNAVLKVVTVDQPFRIINHDGAESIQTADDLRRILDHLTDPFTVGK